MRLFHPRERTDTDAGDAPGIGPAAHFSWASMQGAIKFVAAGTVIYEFNSWFIYFHLGEYVDLTTRQIFSCAGSGIVSSPYNATQDACTGMAAFMPVVQLYWNNIGDALGSIAALTAIFLAGTWLWRVRLRKAWRHGRQDVERQKAHGDARLASEAEALATAARGTGRRSTVHEQEF